MTERINVAYKISTAQVERVGNVIGIAIVERLDRVVALLEQLPAVKLDDPEDSEDQP
jgi:hypothetical protein